MAVQVGFEERVVSKPLGSDLQWLRTFARRYPLPAACGIVAVLITLLGIFAAVVSPDDPLRPNVLARAQGPSWRHWLGTDFIGRDVLSRILHGTKWSLFVAVRAQGRIGTPIENNSTVSVRDWLCLLYTSPSPRDRQKSRMPSSA